MAVDNTLTESARPLCIVAAEPVDARFAKIGELIRDWQPAALVSELPAERPVKAVRLLGEDLVLFRGADGYGLIGRFCAHRGVDLSFGRLEDAGLRCLYHGWKMDVEGTVLEMVSEPAASGGRSGMRAR